MKLTKIIILLVVIATYSLSAKSVAIDANNFIVTNNKTALVQAGNESYNFEVLDSKAEEIFNSNKNHIEIKNFPIRPGYKVDLVLSKQASVLTKDVEIKHFVDGKAVDFKRKSNNHYYGFIKGEARSDVFISYSTLGLTGYIQDESGQMYNISSYLNKLGGKEVLHNIKATSMEEFLEKNNLEMCASDLREDFRPSEINLKYINKNNKVQAKDELYEVKMACDLNFEFYLMFCRFITGGNFNQWKTGQAWFINMTDEQYEQARQMAVDYVENVMAAVSRIYTREVAILIKVGYIKLFDDPFADPYYPSFGQQLGVKLDAMPGIWANRLNEAQDRVLATVFTDVSRQTGGNTLGIAMSSPIIGTLCNKNRGYSALGMTGTVDFPVIPYTQDVEVAAHEFGHNFGCPHTHWCGWPSFGEPIIDSCVSVQQADDAYCISPAQRRIKFDGTIMSYCHIGGRTQLNFHPRMKKIIRETTKKALTQCVDKPNYPVVRLVRPLGEEEYFAGTTATIAFQAANVPQAKLMYSSNSGTDWHDIKTVNTANDSTTTWTVPSEVGNQYLVRIESTTAPSVFDQSILPFSVVDVSINPVFPKEGERIGYLAEQKLTWKKENVDTVRVKYSLDNGQTFTTIVKANISSYKFNFPDVVSDQGILIVESVSNPDVNISVHFKLGKENVEFTSPMAGDTVNLNFLSKTVNFTPDLITERFDIYLRVNQTGEWTKLTNFAKRVDLTTNTFKWTFDESLKAGDKGELRAQLDDGSEVIGESGVFTFARTTGVKDFAYSPLFTISSIMPNPANENFTIEVNNIYPKLMRTDIKLINESGKIVKTISDKYMVSGKSTMLIGVQDLPAGTYYVIIESENNKDVQQLKVVR